MVREGGWNDMGGQGAARNAGSADASGWVACRRNTGHNILPIVQIHVAHVLVLILQTAIDRPKGEVVAQADVHGQPVGGLPGVLEIPPVHPTAVLRLIHVTVVSVVGNSQEEGSQSGPGYNPLWGFQRSEERRVGKECRPQREPE